MSDDVVPDRVVRAERRREFRQLLEDSSLGCPNRPRCGRMLVDHDADGWHSNGDPINPRCPDA